MRRSLAAIALTATLALTGCGGGGSGEIQSVDDLAAAIGCDAKIEDPTPPGVSQAGTCTFEGEELALVTFIDDKTRDAWVGQLEAASALVEYEGAVAEVGPRWAIWAEDPEKAKAAAENVG